jgi:beta-xylosidase
MKIASFLIVPLLAGAALAGPPEGSWMPDNGDGTYRNPVIYADYSDPDAIRVGEDYWMTASSFNHVPGLPILHSRDLVNWKLVNHALPVLVPEEHFSSTHHDEGVWAPSIRHHDGKFFIYWGDPDFGIYMISADDPAGAWSKPVMVKSGKGLIDPCPFWDDDGKAYLVHAWALSRASISNLLTLHRLSPDGKQTLDEGKVIIEGNEREGWRALEGPKFYKRDGWYWVFAPAGGVAQGFQGAFRSRNIWGPYERRTVLHQGATAINGPHQGAWVATPQGDDWFLHFQKTPIHGRVVHLQPMLWTKEGWPLMGTDPDGDGIGEPVTVSRKPAAKEAPKDAPATSDEFDAEKLGRQWQWPANPREEWWSLKAAPGWLRLRCTPAPDVSSRWSTPNLLLQKIPAPQVVATAHVQFEPRSDGDEAGLIVFGNDYALLSLRKNGDDLRLVLIACADARKGGAERELASTKAFSNTVFLRVTLKEDGACQFSWSADGEKFSQLDPPIKVKPPHWTGVKVGLFASARAREGQRGHADFEWFRIGSIRETPAP